MVLRTNGPTASHVFSFDLILFVGFGLVSFDLVAGEGGGGWLERLLDDALTN